MKQEVIYTYKSIQNKSRKLTLKDGRVIKGGESFESSPENIPTAFMDLVQIVPEYKPKEKTIKRMAPTKPKAPVNLNPDVETDVEIENEEELDEEINENENENLDSNDDQENKAPKEILTLKHMGGGKWNVLNEAGEKQLEKNVGKGKAQEYLDELNTK